MNWFCRYCGKELSESKEQPVCDCVSAERDRYKAALERIATPPAGVGEGWLINEAREALQTRKVDEP